VTTRFGLVELDLLAANAGAAIPYPLRVPSFGRVPAERDELFAAAGETLQLRELATADGPAGLAADLVAALARRRGTIDLVLRGRDGTQGAVAVVYGKHAVLCRQDLTAEGMVEVRRIPLSAVPGALTALVPEVGGATAMPVRLPAAAAEEADAGDLGNRLHQVVETHGGDPDELDALTELVGTVEGAGQLGATTTGRNGKDTRSGPELSWLDTASGRVRVSVPTAGTDGWISLNPLSPSTLRAAAEEMVEALRP
jgi:hypothetical protein